MGCKTPISAQYPLVELLTMLLFVACAWRFGFGWQGFGAMVFTAFLISMSGIDLRTQLLPDQLTLPLMWLGLIAASDNLYMSAKPALLGAVVFAVLAWAVWDVIALNQRFGISSLTNLLLLPIDWFRWAAVAFSALASFGLALRALELAVAGRDVRTERQE